MHGGEGGGRESHIYEEAFAMADNPASKAVYEACEMPSPLLTICPLLTVVSFTGGHVDGRGTRGKH